eukprot:2133047-Pyramimonas_sp.AAC.1
MSSATEVPRAVGAEPEMEAPPAGPDAAGDAAVLRIGDTDRRRRCQCCRRCRWRGCGLAAGQSRCHISHKS